MLLEYVEPSSVEYVEPSSVGARRAVHLGVCGAVLLRPTLFQRPHSEIQCM